MKTKISIDLGGTKGLLWASPECQFRFATGIEFSPQNLIQQIQNFVDQYELSIESLCIAVPGLVKANKKVVACDVLPKLEDWTPELDLDFPVWLLNDVEGAMYQQYVREKRNSGVVMVGTAVGAAFQVDGQILRGHSGWAGELGYWPVQTQKGPMRLDEVCGGKFILEQAKKNIQDFSQALLEGDAKCATILEQASLHLGQAIAGVVNLLNPEALYFGGGALKIPNYWDKACEYAEEFALPVSWNGFSLIRMENEDTAVAEGAQEFLNYV